MALQNIIFITGTDTDVGKTMVSLLIMHALSLRQAVYLKPIQTGCNHPDRDSDPAFIHAHLPQGLPQGMKPAQCIHICRPAPKAPLFTGSPISMEPIVEFVSTQAQNHEFVVVEGAGGIFVPINQHQTMLDLALALNAQVLVVGRAGLGTINHTLLTLAQLKNHQLPCLGVILMDPANTVSMEERRENAQAITLFSRYPVHGVIGPIANPDQPEQEALDIIFHALDELL